MMSVFKRELVGYFKNATAYVVFAIYAFLSAMFFCYFVFLENTSHMGNLFGVWLFFVEIIVVAILAMRFFSEEKRNRTDQLLYTTPVRISGIVLGKYLAGMVMYAACTMINLVYVFIIDMFGTPDWGTIFTNFLGTFLLGAAMIAIALFISSTTENPIVAAGGTAAVFILLFMADIVAKFLASKLPQWLMWLPRGLANLNLFHWFDSFTGGILPLTAVVFYVTVAAAFLFFTARILERRRWR